MQMTPIAAAVLACILGAISGDRARQPLTKYENPIKRVTNLLAKMKEELTQEAEDDEKTYDKQACWCETNRKEKVSAVESADAQEQSLKSEIEETTSKQSLLASEIESAKKSKTETEQAMTEAEALRKKEHSEHFELEKSLVKSTTSLKNALVMLSKYKSFKQIPPTVLLSMKTVLRDLAMKYELLTGEGTTSSSPLARHVRTAFLSLTSESQSSKSQQFQTQRLHSELLGALDISGPGISSILPVEYAERLLAEAAQETGRKASSVTFLQVDSEESYKPKSGSLIKALEKMLQDMETQLEEAREKEAKSVSDHKELAKAKGAELKAIMDSIDEYQVEAATTKRELAQAKEDLTQTIETRSADMKFLTELKTTCEAFEKDYKERSKVRSEEFKAVSEATVILTEDDNREHLMKTVSLLQVRATTHISAAVRLRRSRAAKALRSAESDDDTEDLLSAWHGRHIRLGEAAQESSHRTVLEMLAMKAELEPMAEVTQAMDDMISDLKTEQKDEVTLKASCKKRAHQNDLDQMETSDNIKDLKAKLESIDLQASVLSKEIEETVGEKKKLAARVEEAAENRKEATAEAKKVILDQQKTQGILKSALEKLKSFYALVQTDQPASPEYEKSGASGPVIELMQQIIEDSETLVTDTKKADEDDEEKFTAMKAKAAELDAALQKTLTTKKEELSKLEQSRSDTETTLHQTKDTLKSLESAKAALDDECGFVMKNFDLRQKARLKEIEGMQSAKAIILGAK